MDYKEQITELRKRYETRKKIRKRRKLVVLSLILLLLLLIATICVLYVNQPKQGDSNSQPAATDLPISSTDADLQHDSEAVEDSSVPTMEPISTPEPARRGTVEPIPEDVRQSMEGLSMHPNSTISYDDLSYLSIPHYDFNYNVTIGHMVVNRSLAEEVLDIFAELYDVKYPIERMELIDKYNADDYTSIDYNNTSAFNYRVSTDGSGRLSKHALGRAIDINPQINPYVDSSGTGSHSNAAEYWSRNYSSWSSEIAKAAYIGPGTEIYRIFVDEHGWEWGGSWSSYRDYQHFQKFN